MKPVEVAYVGYLLVMGGATLFAVLWMTNPGFRYWLWRESRELSYRWAAWEYAMRTEPVPEWVTRMAAEPDLPPEA